jgi:hypothetical protein
VPGDLPPLAAVGIDQMKSLRASLLPAMAPLGPRYAWGAIGTANMWTDNTPGRLLAAPATRGRWLAGFEMRTWAGGGNDIAASVLQFNAPGEARSFFEQAASARCHRAGKATAALSPPRARNLVWVNPDGPTQEDVLLLRGLRVYRLADVRSRSGLSQQLIGLAIVDRLACRLAAAGCTRPVISPAPQRSS